jgi:hypothetical protein
MDRGQSRASGFFVENRSSQVRNMPIIVSCRCGQRFSAIDELAGKRVSCPSCAQPLVIPSADARSLTGGSAGQSGYAQLEPFASQPTPMAGDNWGQYSLPAFAPSQSSSPGLSRGLIFAMCGAGFVVFLVVIAIFVSSFWTGNATTERNGEPAPQRVFFAAPKVEPPSGQRVFMGPQSMPAGPVPGTPGQPFVPPPPVPPVPTTTPSGPISIKLSAATALPQSLPTGTAMGFSVDYEFVRGQPDPAAEYVWIVESAQGQAVKLGVRLEPRGTLQQFILEFKPGQGPFRTGIETTAGVKLTEGVPFR